MQDLNFVNSDPYSPRRLSCFHFLSKMIFTVTENIDKKTKIIPITRLANLNAKIVKINSAIVMIQEKNKVPYINAFSNRIYLPSITKSEMM